MQHTSHAERYTESDSYKLFSPYSLQDFGGCLVLIKVQYLSQKKRVLGLKGKFDRGPSG